jgi:hypothetical protein
MRPLIVALILAFVLAGCGTRDSVQGGGDDYGGHARVKIGIPF